MRCENCLELVRALYRVVVMGVPINVCARCKRIMATKKTKRTDGSE